MTAPMRIGVVGCGDIFTKAYCPSIAKLPNITITAVCDLDAEKARAASERCDGAAICADMNELVVRNDVDIVLNLTIPAAHTPVNLAALDAGKHVYVEKPLALNREDARAVMTKAEKTNLRVGCAPDTVLGPGHQTARTLIDDGVIGRPLVAMAFLLCRGHETWHPNPEFYYKPGGGPMLDMGPYYLTDLTMLLGPIRRLSGSTSIFLNPRTITSQPLYGTEIQVETPDHVAGTMEFECGAIGTIATSFAVCKHSMPRIEIHGSEGSLSVPDPNGFGGTVKLCKLGEKEWTDAEPTHTLAEGIQRGLGVADMAAAIRENRPHRAGGAQAEHVLDVMLGFYDAGNTGTYYDLPSTFQRPAAIPPGPVEDGAK